MLRSPKVIKMPTIIKTGYDTFGNFIYWETDE